MRLRWVGDSRDYVKWDCVFGNVSERFVFYVPMLRSLVDPTCKHREVQSHFDQRKNLNQFGELFQSRFSVFDFQGREYSGTAADEYFQSVVRELQKHQQLQKVLVFIDPDTGIEPQGGANNEHLRTEDLLSLWGALRPGDRLIVYQHASHSTGWKENLLKRAAEILKMELTEAENLYFDERLARDVCFVVLEKPGA
jgi:hypothetical protein